MKFNLFNKIKNDKNSNQNGQTLIETLVAAFILVMGISAALGLASYSLSATTNIRQQTIALGLAREGIEVVKNIRDTNWLQSTLSTNCYDFLDGQNNGYCYNDWMSGLSQGSHGLTFTPSSETPWSLDGDYMLDISSNPSSSGVLYVPGSGDSGFGRKVIIEQEQGFAPYDENTGPRLKVTSIAWWESKSCPRQTDASPGDPCSVTLETYLTNWRTF